MTQSSFDADEKRVPGPPLKPKDAATLIIVRRDDATPRVLMGKRHASMAFQPNKFVFPGGRVDAGDQRIAAGGALRPDVAAKLANGVTPARARGLALAAVRETFEETGVLVGEPAAIAPRSRAPAWQRYFAHGVVPRLDQFELIARAITPPGRTRRFDARFFMVDASAIAHTVDATHVEELLEPTWLTLFEARALDLMAITRRILDEVEARVLDAAPRPVPFFRFTNGKPNVSYLCSPVAAHGKAASLVAILTTCAASGIGTGLALPLLSLILERRGYPGTVNGLNLATAGLAAILVTPYVPHWIHRFGAAQYLACMLFVVAVAFLAIYASPNLWFWFPARFVLSAALNGLFVVAEFWINQLADERNRGRMVALYATCFAGGFAVGPAVLVVIGTHGIAPFLAGSAMMLVALVPVLIVRRAAPRVETLNSQPMLGLLRTAPAALLAALVFGSIDAGMAGLLPVYAVRSGYSEANAALFVTALSAGALFLQFPLGYLADRMSRRRLLVLCAAGGVAGAALTPFLIAIPLAMYTLLALWGGVTMGIYTVGLTLLGERFKGDQLVGANAASVILYSVGLLAGPAVEGAALDAWNPHGLLVVLGGFCALYLGFLLWRRPAGTTAPSRA